MDTRSRRSRWLWKGCCALGSSAILVLGYAIRLYFYPYDEVAIEVGDIPDDTTFMCLIADRPGGPALMPWSLQKVGPFTMHPDQCTCSYRWSGEAGPFRGSVRWLTGSRVGVLLGDKSGGWRIAWYEGEIASVRGGSLVFGRGSWKPSLRDAVSEQRLDEVALRALGLDYALRNEK